MACSCEQSNKKALFCLRHAKDKAEFDQFMAERDRPRPPDDGAETRTD